MNLPQLFLDALSIGVLVFAVFYPRYRRGDLAVAFIGINAGVPDALPQADWAAAQLQRVGVDAAVSPTLHGGYRRCCLLTDNGRATIDSGLFWIGLRSYSDSTVSTSDAECPRLDASEMVIIETKSGAQPGAIDRLLWRNGIRPCRISKYATGMAAVYPHLPSNRWHSTLTHHFDLPAAA